MKKFFFLLVFLILPIHIYADTIKVDCPETINKNSEFICKLTGESTKLISGVSAQVNISNDLTILAVVIDKKWLGDGKDGNIKIFTDEFATGTFEIGSIKLKSTGTNNSILINGITFYDDKVNSTNIDNVTKTIKLADSVISSSTKDNAVASSNLVDLIIDKYNIDFAKEVKEYHLRIENEDKLDITPILEDDTAKYKIIGNEKLKDGSKIKINITTSLGDKKTYILRIHKGNQKELAEIIFIIILIVLIGINLYRIIRNKKLEVNKNEK